VLVAALTLNYSASECTGYSSTVMAAVSTYVRVSVPPSHTPILLLRWLLRVPFAVVQVMYAYYASSCFGMRWPKFLARNVTTLQLTQMFANLGLLVATFYCCPNSHISMWPSTAMYGVYAALFLDLFRQKYTGRAGRNFTERGAGGGSGRLLP